VPLVAFDSELRLTGPFYLTNVLQNVNKSEVFFLTRIFEFLQAVLMKGKLLVMRTFHKRIHV
jgi:hypothetical protein